MLETHLLLKYVPTLYMIKEISNWSSRDTSLFFIRANFVNPLDMPTQTSNVVVYGIGYEMKLLTFVKKY